MDQQAKQISKEDLLGKMNEAYNSLIARIKSIPMEDASGSKVYGELTIKDVLAHLAGWANLEAGHIENALDGKPFERASVAYGVYPEGADNDELIDKINARMFEQNKDRSPDEVLDDFSKAHARLVAVVERLSDKDLNDPQRFPWLGGSSIAGAIAGNSYEHYQEHGELIRKGLSAVS